MDVESGFEKSASPTFFDGRYRDEEDDPSEEGGWEEDEEDLGSTIFENDGEDLEMISLPEHSARDAQGKQIQQGAQAKAGEKATPVVAVERRRWVVLGLFSFSSFLNMMIAFTYAPVSHIAEVGWF